jgi:hypothetical protein
MRLVVLLALGSGLAVSSAANAQEDSDVFEFLPDHFERRLAARNAALKEAPAFVVDFVVEEARTWPQNRPVTVCMVGGSEGLGTAIAATARRWITESGAFLNLDFGPSGIRPCTPTDTSSIRVGFSYRGYWSLVGSDSARLAQPGEITLNLARFDIRATEDPSFTRGNEFVEVVLHEFGHALGFQHEHQHPDGACDSEFDWDKIYSQLAAPPNEWQRSKVDQNLRQLPRSTAYLTSTPDRTSIMHYSFPRWMFKDPAKCKCCVARSTGLSKLDLAGMRIAYPPDPTKRQAQSNKTSALIGKVLALSIDSPPSVKALVMHKVTSLYVAEADVPEVAEMRRELGIW